MLSPSRTPTTCAVKSEANERIGQLNKAATKIIDVRSRVILFSMPRKVSSALLNSTYALSAHCHDRHACPFWHERDDEEERQDQSSNDDRGDIAKAIGLIASFPDCSEIYLINAVRRLLNRDQRSEDSQADPPPRIRQFPGQEVECEKDGAEHAGTPLSGKALLDCQSANAAEERKAPQRCERRPPKGTQGFVRGGLETFPVLIEPVKAVDTQTEDRE